MNAYIISHNGLGDNLYMVGAINYIKQFYQKIYFICKKKNYDNVRLFFSNDTNVDYIYFDNNETIALKNIVDKVYDDLKNDIFICGKAHGRKLRDKRRIKNSKFLNAQIVDNKYSINIDYINNKNYSFIIRFYKDMKLNLNYFVEYFDLPSYNESTNMLNSICKYYIIFIQLKCSTGESLNIKNLLNKYLNDDKVFLVCNDINLYPKNHLKHELAQSLIYQKIAYYIDIIKNSDEIYIIDSCFVGLVLPLKKNNKLKANTVKIILRDKIDKYKL